MRASGKYYPLKLGRKRKNTIWRAEGLISRGRWVNLNSEDFDKKPEWVKTFAVGTLVDRALGHVADARMTEELAIFTYYPNPRLEMMCFDLLPVDSPLFDMSEEPAEDLYPYEEREWPIANIRLPTRESITPSLATTRGITLTFGATLLLYTLFLTTVVAGEKRNP